MNPSRPSHCPPAAAGWRKPRRSFPNGNCLEAGNDRSAVLVRDTKDRSGPVLRFPAQSWRNFTRAVRASQQ
jgi:Domain of unknown function (DUF397)